MAILPIALAIFLGYITYIAHTQYGTPVTVDNRVAKLPGAFLKVLPLSCYLFRSAASDGL